MDSAKQSLVQELFDIQAVKFGRFMLKSGIESPIYFDLRLIVSYPMLLKKISEMLWSRIQSLDFDSICGVPYTAIPIAAALSVQNDLPMLLKRKEAKGHGLKKMVEGSFTPGETCLLIEDVITSGASIEETIAALESEGLAVKDIALILNREQGGKERLEAKGYRVHDLLTLTDILDSLLNSNQIDAALCAEVKTHANL